MKQIIQDLKSGETILQDVPVPRAGSGKVLIKTHRSLVSLGTEKMLVRFGKANLFEKVRQQPERVKMVLDKMKADGVFPTIEAVYRKLDTPLPLGYSQAGEVVAVGKGVSGFKTGDRVVSNGHHAEYVAVPENLVAKIPDGVSYDEAAFTVVGAIGLQSIRLIQPSLGETVVVMGLGLIGLITAQLLKASGCHVIGFDLDEDKLDLAKKRGIMVLHSGKQDPVRYVDQQTDHAGADAVVITASTTSNTVIKQAANMSRKRGRIVLVGVVGLDIDRSDFYEKELTFQVSCSYGPGRYDENYEQKGLDYPLAYVRWTENRNFKAVLQSIQNGNLDVSSLITERVPLERYMDIYGDMEGSKSVASILEYPLKDEASTASEGDQRTVQLGKATVKGEKGGNVGVGIKNGKGGNGGKGVKGGKGIIAVVGAGNFTQAVVLPSLKAAGASIKYIVSSGGLSGTTLAKKFNIGYSSTDLESVLKDPEVDAVVITTQHNLHAGMTIQALEAGKQVFVEKPLALNDEELGDIIEAVNRTGNTVTVGFNRRFSPHARKMKAVLGPDCGPVNIIANMNAGYIPPEVWVHDMGTGGGRIIGEACHYVDLITYLTGSEVMEVQAHYLGTVFRDNTDNVSIHLKYRNGALGVINYFSNGSKSYSKERVEVYWNDKNLILDNFRKLYGYGLKRGLLSRNIVMKTRQDKGHKAQFSQLLTSWEEGTTPIIPFGELVNTTQATFAAIQSMKEKQLVTISQAGTDSHA